MKYCNVYIKNDCYQVKLASSPYLVRIYTDATLPDELKQKLGILLGSKQFGIDGIGHETVVDSMYLIYITDELYSQMIGELNDEHTRSQSKSEGQEVINRV